MSSLRKIVLFALMCLQGCENEPAVESVTFTLSDSCNASLAASNGTSWAGAGRTEVACTFTAGGEGMSYVTFALFNDGTGTLRHDGAVSFAGLNTYEREATPGCYIHLKKNGVRFMSLYNIELNNSQQVFRADFRLQQTLSTGSIICDTQAATL